VCSKSTRASRYLLGVTALLLAVGAQGHLVYGTKTLHGLTAEADLVLRARIVASGARLEAGPREPGAERPSVEADVLEVLKGRYEQPQVRFAQHGHGVARFEPGDETLLFLLDIARSRELDQLGRKGSHEWVSLQEHQDEFPLEPRTRERLLAAARRYVAAETAESMQTRLALLRRATLDLLTSGDSRLAASALRDLVLAPGDLLLTADEVPTLLPLLDDPNTSMGVRVALLAEFERRRLVDGPPAWLRLLSDETPPRERITAIRAARAASSPLVRERLVALLADPDVEVSAAAAAALGVPGDDQAVAPLAKTLADGNGKQRSAALRSLGQIATPKARSVLVTAAASHPDPETRRRAQAELRKHRASAGRDRRP
jgi:hypothetical protein